MLSKQERFDPSSTADNPVNIGEGVFPLHGYSERILVLNIILEVDDVAVCKLFLREPQELPASRIDRTDRSIGLHHKDCVRGLLEEALVLRFGVLHGTLGLTRRRRSDRNRSRAFCRRLRLA